MKDRRRDAAKGTRATWMQFRQVLPFRDDGEDTLAYQWVLLHARPSVSPPMSEHVYVACGNGMWQDVLRARIQGVPGRMSGVESIEHVDSLRIMGALGRTRTTRALRAYLERQA